MPNVFITPPAAGAPAKTGGRHEETLLVQRAAAGMAQRVLTRHRGRLCHQGHARHSSPCSGTKRVPGRDAFLLGVDFIGPWSQARTLEAPEQVHTLAARPRGLAGALSEALHHGFPAVKRQGARSFCSDGGGAGRGADHTGRTTGLNPHPRLPFCSPFLQGPARTPSPCTHFLMGKMRMSMRPLHLAPPSAGSPPGGPPTLSKGKHILSEPGVGRAWAEPT